MQGVLAVGHLQGMGDGREYGGHHIQRDIVVHLVDDLCERLTLDVFHDHVGTAALHGAVVHGDDIRIGQLRDGASLLQAGDVLEQIQLVFGVGFGLFGDDPRGAHAAQMAHVHRFGIGGGPGSIGRLFHHSLRLIEHLGGVARLAAHPTREARRPAPPTGEVGRGGVPGNEGVPPFVFGCLSIKIICTSDIDRVIVRITEVVPVLPGRHPLGGAPGHRGRGPAPTALVAGRQEIGVGGEGGRRRAASRIARGGTHACTGGRDCTRARIPTSDPRLGARCPCFYLFQIRRHARLESLEASSGQLVFGKLDALDSHIALEMRVESVHHRAVTAGAGLVDDAIAIEYEGGSCHRGKTSLGYVSGVFSRCGHSTIETSPMRWRFRGKRTAGDGRARAPTWQLGSLVTARSPKHDKLFSIFGQKVEL